ncbi:hypothetical protein LAZ67_17002951, partial [Cordylochernes scorpioides]
MTYLAKVRKCDLSKLAYELGEVVPPESRIVDLKRLILNSQSYEEEFAKQLLETLIEEREQTAQTEQAERIERERKEQMVMEFELEKLRIQTTRGNNDTSRSTSNDAHYEIRKLMPKYESKDNDLSFYLILFERQAKRLGLDEDQWAFSLLGLLPYEMTQLIARETEEQSGDYRFVKRLLLKRYKLSPEQFRQKFEKHERSQKGSWRDFAFELRGYFNEWIEGMNVENFDALKDLSVTNQLKKKVPNVLRNHLIDDWTKLNNPDELADKLDEYENVRTEMGPPHWNAKHLIPPSFQQKSARFPNQSEVKETKQGTNVSGQDAARNEISETYPNTLRRMVNRTIRNDKGEPKCFNCNQFGHIARDCPAPRTTLTCRGCGQTGHKERNCTRPKEGLKVANLEVEGLETVPPDVYLKDVKIDNKETVKAMIDTGSSSCLMRESVARRISVDIEPDSTSLYGIGNQTAPAARTVGKTTVDLEIDGVVGKEIAVFIVNDDAQPYDLLIGRTWTDLPYVSFARIGKELHIGYSSEFPFTNLQEEIKSRRIELRATETVQLESDSINFTSAITDEVKDGYVLFTGVDDACVDSLLEVVDGKTTVPIISAGKGKLRVRKNQCVGRVELLNLDDIVVNLDVAEDSFQTKNEEKREGQDQMKRKRPILPEDINVNHSLTSKERQEILDVVNEYRDCFALGMEELGCTDVTKMDIKEIARWYNLIQEYDFEIRHKPGEKMARVDGMSRAPVDDPRDTMEEIVEKNLEVCLTITLEEQILMIQHSDPELRDLIQIFRKDPCDRTVGEQNRINDYSYKGGRLFRMVKNGEEERALYVIPKSMRKSLVVKFHDLMGHFATDRTVNKIKELYWFPSMKRYVRRHVAMCLECLFNKVPGGKQQGFLHPIKSGKRPFSIVHMDHVGPFVRSTKGNQELLVIVDNLTRFVRLSPVRNTSTQNVLKVMKSFVNDFGLPDKIISDRGSCFTSRQFEEFCRGNGIHHTLNSTKHPQGNGMVERVNRTVLSTIATSIEDPRRKDWDLKIKEVERDLNNAVNKTTNKTPFETLHGYSPRFHDGILRRLADEDVDPWTEPDRIQESVRSQIENKQEIMKTYYDKKRCRTIQFEVGEIVVMRHVPKMTGEPTKAQPKYRGPLIITEVLPSDTYRVTQLSERTSGRFYTTTAHISQLKSWHSEEDDSATEESPDEEPEVEDTPRRNPRRSCNARFNRGRLKSRNGRILYATFLVEIPGKGKSKTALRRSLRLQGLQPQHRFEDLPSSTRMVKTEASGTSEVLGTNAGPQSYACHIPRNPPTFSGESAQDPQKWIKMFERVAKYNRWDETQSLANVVFYLEGTAAQWFDNNEDIIDSWTQFKTNLCEVFGKKELTRRAEMTLKTRAQKPGETTESYIQEILSLCSRVNPEMEEEEKVGHLMKGIAEDFYQALIVKDPTTVDELVKFCRQLENMGQRRIKRTRYERLPNVTPISSDFEEDLALKIRRIVQEELQKIMPKMTEVEPFGTSDVNSLEAIVKKEVQQVLAPITRRNIQSQRRRTFVPRFRREDDYTPYAPRTSDQWRTVDNQPICFHCGKPGHVLRYCRERRRTFEEARSRRTLPSADNATPQRPYDLNDDFPTLPRPGGFGRSASPYPGRGRMPRRRSQSPGAGPTRAVIDCGHQELYLEETLPINDDQIDLDVYSADNYVIPPKSSCKISVVGTPLQENRDVLICPNWELSIRKEFIIPSLITTFQQGKADLWIANGNSKPLMIPSRMALGTMSDVDVGSICSLKCDELIQEEEMWTTKFDQKIEAMIDSNLTEDQQNKMMNVLKKFSNVFDFSGKSQPARSKIKHKIDTGDHAPTKQRPYRVSGMERKIIQQEVDRMMKQDIIQFSESPWSSPVVLVKKKNGSWRFCVDYRRLNKITKKDVYPLPRVDDALDNLSGARYYSSMDLRTGYWQIEVDEHDREKTAFITPDGLYEFRVMPFGLCNAPATFERMMDTVLKGLKWNICLCYLDDIVVYGPSFEEHIKRLEVVLECLQQAGLNVNNEKCLFGSRQLKILGHVVNENGIHPDPEKVEAILKFPSPKSIPDVRSFLGLCSYYRRFVENFSCKAKPLNDLLKNDAKFCWNKEQENAFEILKEALTSEPVLGHFIEDAETHIHTDASGYGIGAVLIQIQGGAERPIAYASRTLTKAEKNYSTTEKELLAVVWATSKFRPYLFGRNFTVVTDHHSLCWLAGLKDPSGRLARWALRLQEFDITVVYKSGRKHKDADCLSRNPVPEEQEDFPNIISIIDIRAEQSRDPNLAKIIDKIEETGPFKGFEVMDGVLYKRNYEPYGRQRLLVLPKQMRLEVLKNLHDAPTAGHLGFAKTYDRARKIFFWGGMYKTIRQYIAHCRECQRRKSVPQRPPGQLMPIPPANFPFQKIGMDLLGRFPVTNQGNKWIIVCTEYMTRFATTKAIPDAGAMEIARFIVEEIILRHGAPQQIITDRGTNFMSQIIKEINNLSGINHLKTTAYHPQTNGLTERLNKTLTDMLSMYVDVEQKNWDEVLPFVTFAYNTAKQETTGFSPFFLVHGREAETTLDTLLPYQDNDDVGDYVQHLITTAEEARNLAQLHLYRGQEKDRKYYDRKHRPVDYNVGDLVWLFIPVRKVGLSEKLIKKYFGPYRITRKLSPVNYEIEAISDSPKRRKTRDTVHVLRMKPYLDPLLQEEISGSTPNKEPVLKQRFSDPEPISGPVTRSRTAGHCFFSKLPVRIEGHLAILPNCVAPDWTAPEACVCEFASENRLQGEAYLLGSREWEDEEGPPPFKRRSNTRAVAPGFQRAAAMRACTRGLRCSSLRWFVGFKNPPLPVPSPDEKGGGGAVTSSVKNLGSAGPADST